MKSYAFKSLKIGQSSSCKVKFTKESIKKFISISKDYSKIHFNKKYAVKHGFNDKITHGMLLGVFYSRFIGVYLPGKHSLCIGCDDIKFNEPIYLNNVIYIKGKVVHLNNPYKVATIKIKATNRLKKIVSTATAVVKLNE